MSDLISLFEKIIARDQVNDFVNLVQVLFNNRIEIELTIPRSMLLLLNQYDIDLRLRILGMLVVIGVEITQDDLNILIPPIQLQYYGIRCHNIATDSRTICRTFTSYENALNSLSFYNDTHCHTGCNDHTIEIVDNIDLRCINQN